MWRTWYIYQKLKFGMSISNLESVEIRRESLYLECYLVFLWSLFVHVYKQQKSQNKNFQGLAIIAVITSFYIEIIV